MIFDSHVYCFQPIDAPAGHTSGAEHLKWVQAAHAGHHQPAWRVRDRAAASSRPLAPEGKLDLDRMPDMDFRADHKRGRVVWTVDGEDYTKQFFPPNLYGLAYSPHSLIAEMDYAGVDMALLHTDPMLGRDSAYLAKCVRQYPGRLTSMAPVDEWRIKDEPEVVIRELEHAINDLGLHAIKFIPQLAYRAGAEPWDDGYFRPFWEAATRLNVPVFFTLGTGPASMHGSANPDQQRQGYLDELAILMRWMDRYPDSACSLTHGFPYRLFLEGNRLQFPDAVWEPFRAGDCHLEVCFPIRLGDLFDFPYREVWPALEQMVKEIGADRLLWGTDMPFQNRFCTYRQSRRWIEQYCTFLGPAELAAIMGGTARRLLGV